MVAAVAAAYANAVGAGFQFDDWNVIVDEPRVQSLAAWWASMPAIRPLVKLSYVCSNSLGFGPAGFHLPNIAIHAINSALAFLLPTRPSQRPAREEQQGRNSVDRTERDIAQVATCWAEAQRAPAYVRVL